MDGEANHSPLFTNYIFKWLDNALDFGITEADFWQMTIAELDRAISSKRRVEKTRAQERASLDYILADLIGRSVSRIYSSSNTMPEISQVYPSLFDNEEIKEQSRTKKAELSAIRFKQFANFHNAKLKGGANINNDRTTTSSDISRDI
jgi:hypothetical protein